MSVSIIAAAAPQAAAINTQNLVTYLQGLFGPLFLGIVGIVALFFLFTREIARFVQFIVLAVAIAVVFYTTSSTVATSQSVAAPCLMITECNSYFRLGCQPQVGYRPR